MKYIRVTMPDGSKWDVPAKVVAESYAKYYSDEDTGYCEYDDEYDLIMGDNVGLVDWAENNMDWTEVSDAASQAVAPSVDYEQGWVNGQKEIMEY